jgi:hypothetical protein
MLGTTREKSFGVLKDSPTFVPVMRQGMLYAYPKALVTTIFVYAVGCEGVFLARFKYSARVGVFGNNFTPVRK